MDSTLMIRDALLALDQPFYLDTPLTPELQQDLQQALQATLPDTIDPYAPETWQLIEDCLATM